MCNQTREEKLLELKRSFEDGFPASSGLTFQNYTQNMQAILRGIETLLLRVDTSKLFLDKSIILFEFGVLTTDTSISGDRELKKFLCDVAECAVFFWSRDFLVFFLDHPAVKSELADDSESELKSLLLSAFRLELMD